MAFLTLQICCDITLILVAMLFQLPYANFQCFSLQIHRHCDLIALIHFSLHNFLFDFVLQLIETAICFTICMIQFVFSILICSFNHNCIKLPWLEDKHQQHHRYWVHPINQSHQQFGEFHTLYKDLRKYPDRFYTYYRMSTEQFDCILAQIEHLIYKPNANWWCSICCINECA